jgi:hypothetical protein
MKSTTRYNFPIPTDTYRSLQDIAEKEGTTVADLLRRAIRWLLYVRTIRLDPEARLLVEQGGETRELVLDLLV